MLVTLDDMKTYLGIELTDTTYDAFLTEQILLFSSAIEGYCGRVFLAADYIQTYYMNDYTNVSSTDLPVYHYPVNSVAYIQEVTSNLGVDDTPVAVESYDYRINSKCGSILRLCYGVPRAWFASLCGNTRLEVSYNAGYATTPLEIDAVVKALVEDRYSKKTSGVDINFGSDVQRVAIAGVISVDFDYSLQANERNVRYGMLLGNYVNVLDAFRSERPVIGEVRNEYVS